MQCHACSDPAARSCFSCGRFFCDKHGRVLRVVTGYRSSAERAVCDSCKEELDEQLGRAEHLMGRLLKLGLCVIFVMVVVFGLLLWQATK